MLTGAYYYPWYSGEWLLSTPYRHNPPVLGQYDNTTVGKAPETHFQMMKENGIDFAVISWEPERNYEYLLDLASDVDIKVCVMYESLFWLGGRHVKISREDMPKILEDFKYLGEDLDETCWLRIDGKPVVIVYVSRNYKEREHFADIREALGTSVFLVGDEAFWQDPRPDRIASFDALTTYNWYWEEKFSGTEEEACDSFLANIQPQASSWARACEKEGVPYWPVAMPGYDDTSVRPMANHPKIPRLDGKTFQKSLKAALDLATQAMVICSFNEHYEGTGIEPLSSSGSTYLSMAKEMKNEASK